MNISDLDYLEVISSETENALAGGGRRYYFKNENKYVDSDKTMNLEFGDTDTEKDNSYNWAIKEDDASDFSSKDLDTLNFGRRADYLPKPGMRGSGAYSFSISYYYSY